MGSHSRLGGNHMVLGMAYEVEEDTLWESTLDRNSNKVYVDKHFYMLNVHSPLW